MSKIKLIIIPNNDRDISLFNLIIENNNKYKEEFLKLNPFFIFSEKFTTVSKTAIEKSKIPYLDYDNQKLKPYEIIIKYEPDIVLTSNDQSMFERCFLLANKYEKRRNIFYQIGSYSNNLQYTNKKLFIRNIRKIKKKISFILERYYLLYKTISYYENSKMQGVKYVIKDLLINIVRYENRGMYASELLVNGYYEKKLLIENIGINSSKIKVVGDVRYDKYKPLLHQNTKVTKERKSILVLTSTEVEHEIWSSKDKIQYLTDLFSVLDQFIDEFDIIIKPHPSEDHSYYTNDFVPKGITIKIGADLIDEINKATIIISTFSTTVIEASILKKYIIITNFKNEKHPLPYIKKGLAKEAKNKNSLIELINGYKNWSPPIKEIYEKSLLYFIGTTNFDATSNLLSILKPIH